jgi:hypothetical protein
MVPVVFREARLYPAAFYTVFTEYGRKREEGEINHDLVSRSIF